ncbi:MAG: two-component system response regulator DegU, partial [Cyclobacteriaceae bacterium]
PSGRSIKLTPREIEILGLICEELTMKEIGEQLFLSEQTIHTHRKNLMKKAKVSNAVGLVKYAIREQVVYL